MTLRLRDMAAYGQMAFPAAFAGLPLYIQAPDHYATRHGLSLGFIGIVLLAIRLADAVLDPMIGRWSDRHAAQRPLVMAGAAAVLALSFIALYHGPAQGAAAWFVATVFAATLAFSTILINLNAVGSLMAPDEAAKNRVASWREGFGAAGLLAAVTLPAVTGDMGQFSLAVAGLLAVSAAVFFLWIAPRRNLRAQAAQEQGGFPPVLAAPFAGFFAAYAVSMLASALPAVLVLFYIRDWLGLEAQAGLFLGAYFLSAIAAMPLWRALAARWGGLRAWGGAMVFAALSLAPAALLAPGDVAGYLAICVLSGAALGAELFLPPAILSARIDAAGLRAQTSAFYGVYALCMKGTLALAGALAFGLLGAVGFAPAQDNSACALSALVICYAVLPAALKMLAVLVLVKYGEKNEKNRHPFSDGSHHHA